VTSLRPAVAAKVLLLGKRFLRVATVAAPRLVTPIPQMALRDDAAADAAAAAARDTSVDGAA